MLVAPSRTSYLPHGLVGASSVNQASKHYNTQPQAPGRATRSSVCARPRRRGGRLSLCGGRQTAAGAPPSAQSRLTSTSSSPKSGLPYLAVPHFPPRDGYRQRALHRQAGHGSARGGRLRDKRRLGYLSCPDPGQVRDQRGSTGSCQVSSGLRRLRRGAPLLGRPPGWDDRWGSPHPCVPWTSKSLPQVPCPALPCPL